MKKEHEILFEPFKIGTVMIKTVLFWNQWKVQT